MKQAITIPDTSELMNSMEDLTAMAGRAIIDSAETEDKGGDLLKMLKNIKKKAEADRKEITQPINQGLAAINAKYKEITAPVDAAIAQLNKKMVDYKMEQQRLALEQEEAARKAREEEALKQAEKLAEQGKGEAADDVIDLTTKINEKAEQEAEKSTVHSTHGATTTMVDNWSADVTDVKALCLAVAEGRADVDCITPNFTTLNKLAKSMKDKLDLDGVTAVNNPMLRSR